MTTTFQRRQRLAKVVTLLLFVVGTICCLCGVCQSIGSLAQVEGGVQPAIVLPNGEEADETVLQGLAFLNLFFFAGIALVIILVGVAVWYFFARQQPYQNLYAKAAVVFLFIGSFAFFLVSIFAMIGFFLMGGMGLTNDALGVGSALFSFGICMIPGFILALAGIVVWFWFVRRRNDEPKPIISQEPLQDIPEQAYYAYMQDLLSKWQADEQEVSDEAWLSAQARTLMALREANQSEKEKLLQFLYRSELISDDSLIKLKGADLSGIKMAESDWHGINLAGANLSAADLHGANLQGANLQATTLHAADLRFTDLRSANLQEADLREAKLHRANLRLADLRDANLAQANLWQADLSDAQVTNEQLQAAKSLKEATLPDSTLSE